MQKKDKNNKTEENSSKQENKSKNFKQNAFMKSISVRENREDLDLIEKVKQDKNLMYKMNIEELKQLNQALKRRKSFLENKVEQLKNEIAIKKRQLKKLS